MSKPLGPIDFANRAVAEREQRPAGRHTADTITDDALDALYAERDQLRRNFRRALDTAEAANARATSAEDAIERVRHALMNQSYSTSLQDTITAALDEPTTT